MVGLLLAVGLNALASRYHVRVDLTEDQRYTISDATVRVLENLDDEVFVKVYLAGDFPTTAAGFKRLQNATRETLDQFRVYAGDRVQYRFINPAANGDAKARQQFQLELIRKGLNPTQLRVKQDEQQIEKLIFPGALVSYRGKEVPVLLLRGNRAGTQSQMLNQSVEGVEFELASAIRKLTQPEKKRVGILQGYSRLDPARIADLTISLQEGYEVFRVDLPRSPTLQGLDAILLVKPDTAIREADKYKIDQFIVGGGKALFFVDALRVDSVARPGTLAFPYQLNLDDLLFRYGVRLNYNLVKDLNCGKIPLNVGTMGNQPQIQLMPWTFYPLLNNFGRHPIVRNLDAVYAKFVGTIDTVRAKGIRKTPLMLTSPYTRVVASPVAISFNEARKNPDPAAYRDGPQPVAYLLEGRFESLYKNRMVASDERTKTFRAVGNPAKIVVCSDGDLVVNEFDQRTNQHLSLGTDRFMGSVFANKDFVLHALDYLMDDQGVILARNKEIQLRPLDKLRLREARGQWQALNLAAPVALVVGFGLVQNYRRRRRYASGGTLG
ncbi:MAG: gliding motility-associated ABC transporter substrate-binding protein GldG [Ferruginibacter sp.]|nr:gliding motility-associated ABC transporter substrate-binding protein GldG [Cytophagales bacterium]